MGGGAGDTLGLDFSRSVRSGALGALASVQSADLGARLSAPGGLVLAGGDLTVQVGGGAAVSVTGTFTTLQALAAAVNAAMGGRGSAASLGGAGGTGERGERGERGEPAERAEPAEPAEPAARAERVATRR